MFFIMTAEITNSWIFLVVEMNTPESHSSLREIIGVADGINHAASTHAKLQNAFGSLLKQGLISKEGKKYRITDKGLILYKEANAISQRTFGMWGYLKKHFATLSSNKNYEAKN